MYFLYNFRLISNVTIKETLETWLKTTRPNVITLA